MTFPGLVLFRDLVAHMLADALSACSLNTIGVGAVVAALHNVWAGEQG